MPKACSKCGETKPLEMFKKERRASSGFAAICKACNSAAQKSRANSRAVNAPSIVKRRKVCPSCKKDNLAEQYYTDKRNADWLSGYCKDCTNQKTGEYYAQNKDKCRELNRQWVIQNRERANALSREWYRKHPEVNKAARRRWRARKKNAEICDLTAKEWLELLEHNGNKCGYCGGSDNLSQDHAVPLTRGGDHTLTNIIPSCRPCNSRKHTKTALEFIWEQAA